jgi:hypothetical protein
VAIDGIPVISVLCSSAPVVQAPSTTASTTCSRRLVGPAPGEWFSGPSNFGCCSHNSPLTLASTTGGQRCRRRKGTPRWNVGFGKQSIIIQQDGNARRKPRTSRKGPGAFLPQVQKRARYLQPSWTADVVAGCSLASPVSAGGALRRSETCRNPARDLQWRELISMVPSIRACRDAQAYSTWLHAWGDPHAWAASDRRAPTLIPICHLQDVSHRKGKEKAADDRKRREKQRSSAVDATSRLPRLARLFGQSVTCEE